MGSKMPWHADCDKNALAILEYLQIALLDFFIEVILSNKFHAAV